MTLEEKTIELQSQFPPLKIEQIIEILKNFKPDEEVVEEVEEVPTEEVKETPTEEVVSETEVTSDEQTPEAGNQDSSITPDPVLEQTNNTGSDPLDSGSGKPTFTSMYDEDATAKNNLDVINQRALRFKEQQDFDDDIGGVRTKATLKQLPIGSKNRTDFYIEKNLAPDDTIDKNYYDRASGNVMPNSYLIETDDLNSEFSLIPPEIEISEDVDLKTKDQLTKALGRPSDPLGLDEPKKEISDNFWQNLKTDFEEEKKEGIGTIESYIDGYIEENDLDLDFPNLYFNKDNSTSFIENNYGGADAIAQTNLNPIDFEGFLNRNGFAEEFNEKLNNKVYEDREGETNGALAKERDLRRYLDLYKNEQNSRLNKINKLNQIKKSPGEFKTRTFGDARADLVRALSLPSESDVYYISENAEKYKEYIGSQFSISSTKDKEYSKQRANYAKELDNRGDWYAAAANIGTGIVEAKNGLLTGFYDLATFALELGGSDTYVEKLRNNEAESQLAKDSSYYTEVVGKTINIDGVNYAKDKLTGVIYNVSAGYNASQLMDPMSLKSLDEKIEKEGVVKEHNSLRGYLTVGGNVFGNVGSQVIGQKGVGFLTKAAKLRTLATLNGFSSIKKYQNTLKLAEAIGGKAASRIRIPVKKSTVDAMLFQGSYGAAIGYNNTLKEAKAAGFNDKEAAALAYDGSLLTGIWYMGTGPISPRTNWLGKSGEKSLVDQLKKSILKARNSKNPRSFTQDFQQRLLNISNNLKTKGYTFLEEGGKETIQENVQQAGEFFWINPTLNKKSKTNFLQDTYSYQEAKTTSILSFATGGLLSQIKMPSFKPNADAMIANYSFIAKNSQKAENSLSRLVDSGFATQAEADEVMANAEAIFNQTPRIPKWLDGGLVLPVSKLMQERQNLINSKKNTDKAFHQNIDDRIEDINLEIDGYVRPAADEQRAKLQTGVENFLNKIRKAKGKVDMVEFDTTAEANAYRQELLEQGGNVMQSDNYGDMVITEEGNKILIVDNQINTEDNVVTTGVHEGGHFVLSETVDQDPDAAKKLGNALVDEMFENENVTIKNNNINRRLAKYASQGVTTPVMMEEIMMMVSEGLINGDIEFNETSKTKIGDLIRRTLQNVFGIKIKFKDGESVLNFLRDYNRTIETQRGGKAIARVATEGAKVDIADPGIEAARKVGRVTQEVDPETGEIVEVEVTPEINQVTELVSKESKRVEDSQEVQRLYDEQGVSAAMDIIEKFKPITSKIVEARSQAPNFDRQLLTDEIETGKRGILDLVMEYKPESGVPLAAYINKFLPARAIEASKRVLGEEFTTDVTEAKGVVAEEVTEIVEEKPTKLTKPSSLLPAEAVTEITEQVKEKIKGIDPKSMTFKKLGDLAPEVIAREIGIPVKKLTDPRANLSKGDATAIQQFVNKNADKLLRILPEGSVTEAATDDILGTSTGVPTGLLKAFYTKGKRSTRGAGLTPFIKNKNISKADFLEAFGIVEGKKAEGFSARSSQAQALKGIASLYGRLVTNEVSRSPEVGLKPEAKQRVAAGKAKTMASQRIDNVFQANKIPGPDGDFAQFDFDWRKTLPQFLKSIGGKPIDMSTEPGRKRFLEYAVSSGLTKKLPPKFWESLAFTSQNAFPKDVLNEIKAIDPEFGSFVKALNEETAYSFPFRAGREYSANLPFKNVEDAKEWIKTTGIENFAEDSKEFDAMLESEGVYGKRFNLPGKLSDPDFISRQNDSINGLEKLFKIFQNEIMRDSKGQLNAEGIAFVGALLSSSSYGQGHFLRSAAPIRFYEKGYLKAGSGGATMEHTLPATIVGKYLFVQALQGNLSSTFKNVKNNYFQGPLLNVSDDKLVGVGVDGKKFNYKAKTPDGWLMSDNVWARYFNLNVAKNNGGINPANIMLSESTSVLDKFNIMANGTVINNVTKKGLPALEKQNNSSLPNSLASKRNLSTQQQISQQSTLDNALSMGRRTAPPIKKIRIFDFDDTLAKSKSMIIVALPEQVQKITRTGDSVKVINTVYKGVVDLIAANNKIKSINFSSEASEPSRVRLYNTLANKLKKDLGWDLDLFETTFLDEKQTDDFTLTKPTKQTSIKKLKSNLNFTEDIAGNFKTSFKIKNKKYNVALDKKGKGDYELNFSLVGEGTGKTFKINATQFAEQAADLEAEGATFDFSQFEQVIDGKKGPLFDVAKKIADARGTEDLFILTARPQEAAGPIKEFMKALGIDIPLKNITGLADGTAQAKAMWVADKAAQGYNDFYFADDAIKNVQAVKDVLSQLDVKRKVQRAIPSTIKQKVKFSKSSLRKTINSPQYKKFRNNIKDRVLYHGGSETINTIRDNNAVWFYLDDAEAAQMWGDGEVYSVKASDIKDMVVLPDLNDVSMFTNHLQEKFNLEQKLYDIRDILKHPKADEMIAEWMDWSSKNDMTYDIGYNLYEKQNVTNGAAVTVLGVIPKNKIQQVSSKSSKKSLRGNQAVKDVLSQIDVKSKAQQVRASKRKTFDTVVNDMIQDSSGIESYKTFSAAKARTVGRDKGRFDWLTMASSAEDFKGLLYRLLGNGKKGEAQYEFLKTNLIDPYNKAEDSITQAKISAANDFMALKEQFPGLPKTLETETGVGKFTYQHALRTYMWTQQGMSIPGLSKADVKKLNKFITDDAKLQAFADQLISIQKGKPYPEPGKDWLAGNLTTDIIGGINKVNRKEYLQEWQENVDIIFSPENLNKMEAAYGTRWRKALENSLARMKAGTNRLGYNDQTSAVLDWVNNSVGAVMFLNTKSALLQTISAVNFINWGDNNIIAAGRAFANQKQFWGDFMTLMNSDYLVQRRNGLKINVSESEIADAVKNSKNKVNAAISYLLSKGFVLTRYADSFAIASGGATFYRNRMNKYIKEGMDPKLAQEQAFQDFRLVAEESQQSSSPDKISMQQASAAGRVILNWANTPMQYVRIQKRDLQDLIAGRGDPKVKMARIAYYGVIQNLIFNAMQQALFVIGFGDDEDDEEKSAAKKKQDNNRIARAANGMIDSQLKGLGIAGAGMVAVKNTLMKIYEESGKQRPEYEKAAIEALSFSPAISSKYRKIVGGLKSFSWNMKEMKEKGFSLDNPAYLAGAQIITAVTNIPVDRVIKKANNIRGILSEQSQKWQKVLLFGGWSTWDVGLRYYGGWDKPVEPTPAEIKRQAFDKMKKDTKTSDQVQMLLDLGLDKKQIKALRYEDARVKKIIELQNKNKDARSQK